MPITTTRVGLVIDTLTTLLKANPTFADPVKVYDGPNTEDTMWTQAVFIGFDGDWRATGVGYPPANVQYEASLINQEIAYVSGPVNSNFEQQDIQCAAATWSGDVTVQTARNVVIGLLDGVEDVLRTDRSLGIDGSTIAVMHVGTLDYIWDDSGNLGARIKFVIHVQTTLMSS